MDDVLTVLKEAGALALEFAQPHIDAAKADPVTAIPWITALLVLVRHRGLRRVALIAATAGFWAVLEDMQPPAAKLVVRRRAERSFPIRRALKRARDNVCVAAVPRPRSGFVRAFRSRVVRKRKPTRVVAATSRRRRGDTAATPRRRRRRGFVRAFRSRRSEAEAPTRDVAATRHGQDRAQTGAATRRQRERMRAATRAAGRGGVAAADRRSASSSGGATRL